MFNNRDCPTVRICVVCLGNLIITTESDDGKYKAHVCIWCNSTGIMSDAQYFHWKLMSEKGLTHE